MSKFLVYAKSLGNSKYADYKKYLKTKSPEEIIELKADLKTKVEKWNKIISTFIILIILSILSSLWKLTYDFTKNVYQLYPNKEAIVMVKGLIPIIVLLGLFFILLGVITYNNLYNAKKKLIFLEEFEKENEKKSNQKLEI